MLAIVSHWRQFSESERGQRALRALRVLLLVGLVGYLGYKLVDIGWRAIWQAMPTSPLFYVLFLALYFLLPLTEVLIYRLTWSFKLWRSVPAFIKKRIYNKEVMGYSGEVYFFTWARKHVDLPAAELAKTIRDNNIISSAASTLIALALLGIFMYVGHLRITDLVGDGNAGYWAGAAILTGLMIPVAIRFRKYIFSMAMKTALVIFGIQCARLITGQALQIAQWSVVMPDVTLSVWFTFAAVSIILTRIPFLPSQNLIFMGVGVELASSLGIPEAAMFSMLGVLAALDKLLNFGFFLLFSMRGSGAEAEADAGVWTPQTMAEAAAADAPAPREASSEAVAVINA